MARTNLQCNNPKQESASNGDLLSTQHHGTAHQLTNQVEQDKQAGKEVAAAPAGVHVVSLLVPLGVHADAILKEGADQAEACHMGQDVFGMPQHLSNNMSVRSMCAMQDSIYSPGLDIHG